VTIKVGEGVVVGTAVGASTGATLGVPVAAITGGGNATTGGTAITVGVAMGADRVVGTKLGRSLDMDAAVTDIADGAVVALRITVSAGGQPQVVRKSW
jgi:hypothetical protein